MTHPPAPEAIIRALREYSPRSLNIMEVCGTHTVSAFRSGVRSVLPEGYRLISGPGCPVCVTSQGQIDGAVALADVPDAIVLTYGDMLRVPGSRGSLADARARGRDVRVVTSAMEAPDIALASPGRQVVFLAAGFETTAPATAAMLSEAAGRGLRNLSILCLHKRTPPAVRALLEDAALGIDALILPGHVCVILGHAPFLFISEQYERPCVIAGFSAESMLLGVLDLTIQKARGETALHSVYPDAVKSEGNRKATELMDRVFVPCDSVWRGLGKIPSSGMRLAPSLKDFDAELRFGVSPGEPPEPRGCRCGDILRGRITPPECPLFRTTCTPAAPVGPCMVSSEGTCGAYFRFYKGGTVAWEIS